MSEITRAKSTGVNVGSDLTPFMCCFRRWASFLWDGKASANKMTWKMEGN
jgi:hypothetical protein